MAIIIFNNIFSLTLTLAVIVIVVRRDFIVNLVIKTQCRNLSYHKSVGDSGELLQLTRI